jgi:uncharacterized protein DUF4439
MTELEALQAALAAEHATVYGYGVAGAVLRGADRGYATAALNAHLALRDRLIALVTSLKAAPVAAQPAYQLPSAVTDATTARALAAHLEEGGAGAVWDVIAASAPGGRVRAAAITWLSDAAVRAAHWGAKQALPGQPQPS